VKQPVFIGAAGFVIDVVIEEAVPLVEAGMMKKDTVQEFKHRRKLRVIERYKLYGLSR